MKSRKNRHPLFKRPNRAQKARVSDVWRKPRGIDSKQRMHLAWAGAHPDVGWRTPAETRGLHPSGAREVLVRNGAELEAAASGTVVRFAAQLGGRKRAALRERARAKGLRVLN
jgi:large subunit ribosomal protein L32e